MRTSISGLLLVAISLFAGGCAKTKEQKQAEFLQRGKQLMEKKDYTRAVLEFRNAVQLSPTDARLYFQLAEARLASGDLRNALADLKKATELDPKFVPAQLKLAQLMTTSGDKAILADAEKRVKDVLSVTPGDLEALTTLATAEWRLGKPEEAQKSLNEALSRFPKHLETSISLARIKLARKDLTGAEGTLKKAVESDPASAEPPVALGAFYVMLNKPSEARQAFQKALEVNPKHTQALLDLASLESSAGDHNQAKSLLGRASAIVDNGPALVMLAVLQLQEGQKDEAAKTYKKVSALPDKKYKPLYGAFLFRQGQRDAAIREFERLSNEDPRDTVARGRLASAYIDAGKVREAEKLLAESLQRSPKDAEALTQRSRLDLQKGNLEDAETNLRLVLSYRPRFAEAHYALGRIYAQQGIPLRARQEFNEALSQDRKLLPARVGLAQVLVSGNSAKTALQLMDETPAEQKNTLSAIVARNWVLLALGGQAEVRRVLDQALPQVRDDDLLIRDGALRMASKDLAGARASAEEVLKQNPEELRALRMIADTYIAEKQFPKAEQRLRAAAAGRPQSAPVQEMLGDWLVAAGKPAEARTAYTAAKAGLSLARLDFREGKLDSARLTLTGLLATDKRNTSAKLLLAAVEEKAGRREAAAAQYKSVVDADGSNVTALTGVARLMAAADPAGALPFAQNAVELAPENPDAQDALGWVYYRQGRPETAVKYLEKAVGTQDTPRRKYHLGLAYTKIGKRNDGSRLMVAALDKDPTLAGTEQD